MPANSKIKDHIYPDSLKKREVNQFMPVIKMVYSTHILSFKIANKLQQIF